MSDDITKWLQQGAAGDGDAANRALAAMLDELRRIARRYLAQSDGLPSLEPDDVIGGAVARMGGAMSVEYTNRGHFLAYMSVAMRHFLIDQLRKGLTDKAGGGQSVLSLDKTGFDVGFRERRTEILDLHAALAELARRYPDTARVIELTHFVGLTAEETAAATGISPREVVRELKFGRSFLRKELDR